MTSVASVPLPLGFWKPASSGGPAETPATYSGLQVWYRSSDLSLNDGDPVGTWTDRSANANNATAAGSLRPTFKTNIIGTVPTLRFDPNVQQMTIGTSLSYAINSQFTAMTLLKPITAYGDLLQSAGGHYFRHLASNALRYNDTITSYDSDTLGTLTDFKLITLRKTAGQTRVFRENKTARGTSVVDNAGYAIGRFCSSADLVELACWDVGLSDTQVDSLYDNYFKVLYPTLP
jgi:hypothetical protein